MHRRAACLAQPDARRAREVPAAAQWHIVGPFSQLDLACALVSVSLTDLDVAESMTPVSHIPSGCGRAVSAHLPSAAGPTVTRCRTTVTRSIVKLAPIVVSP
jgi:hypothetical protein